MSFLASLFEAPEARASIHDPEIAAMFLDHQNSAGIPVTPDSAMRSAAIYACVRVLAEDLASLPLQMFRRLSDGSRVLATEHPLYRVVHQAPNSWQTASEFRYGLVEAAALRGTSYARIVARRGQRMLVPLNPDRTRVKLGDDYRLAYEHYDAAGRRQVFTQEEVLRIPHLTRDGVEPVSPIRLHAETVAQNLLTTRYTNTFLKNGGRPPGFIKMDQPFKDNEARLNFAGQLKKQIGGENRGATLVLEQAEYKAIGVSNEDAQLAEICNMSLLEICRIYRVPPHMIQHLDRATWGNIEHQAIGHVVHTLGPWIVRIEQALTRDLLTEDEQEEFFFEHNVDGLLRGDSKTRTENFLKARQGGWLSINDIRRILNLSPIEDGDDYLQPMNMAPVGSAAASGEDSPAPPPSPENSNGGT